MNDREFKQLRHDIHVLKIKLDKLQRKHVRETGQRYSISGPLQKPSKPIELKRGGNYHIVTPLPNYDEVNL